MFSEAIESVDSDAPGEMNTVHPWWTNMMFNTSRLLQEEGLYKVNRDESTFKLVMCLEQKMQHG